MASVPEPVHGVCRWRERGEVQPVIIINVPVPVIIHVVAGPLGLVDPDIGLEIGVV